MRRFSTTITTDSAGAATKLIPIRGRLLSITYVRTDYDAGVDFTITLETTARDVWVESNVNASTTRSPRAATHDSAGAGALYAAAGQPVLDYFFCDENLKIVIAAGGNVKSGVFHVTVED